MLLLYLTERNGNIAHKEKGRYVVATCPCRKIRNKRRWDWESSIIRKRSSSMLRLLIPTGLFLGARQEARREAPAGGAGGRPRWRVDPCSMQGGGESREVGRGGRHNSRAVVMSADPVSCDIRISPNRPSLFTSVDVRELCRTCSSFLRLFRPTTSRACTYFIVFLSWLVYNNNTVQL